MSEERTLENHLTEVKGSYRYRTDERNYKNSIWMPDERKHNVYKTGVENSQNYIPENINHENYETE